MPKVLQSQLNHPHKRPTATGRTSDRVLHLAKFNSDDRDHILISVAASDAPKGFVNPKTTPRGAPPLGVSSRNTSRRNTPKPLQTGKTMASAAVATVLRGSVPNVGSESTRYRPSSVPTRRNLNASRRVRQGRACQSAVRHQDAHPAKRTSPSSTHPHSDPFHQREAPLHSEVVPRSAWRTANREGGWQS